MDQGLRVHLKPSNQAPETAPGIHLALEDLSSPIAAKTPQEFGLKLRGFLDDIEHLKFLYNLSFVYEEELSAEERAKLESYEKVAKKVVHDLRESLGNRADSLLGFKNIFANLPRILKLPSLEHIKIARSTPAPLRAVVISAGPSLELEWENLRALQSRCLIIAVDAVLRRLLQEKIIPHIVVATERFNDTLPFFEELKDLNRCTLIGQATITPELFDKFPGQKIVASKFTGPFLWLPFERQHTWMGSCVSHFGYGVACKLGAQSVALVGQDLCFHPDTFQTHAFLPAYPTWSEPRALETAEHNGRKPYFVRGNTRDRVPTQADWDMFASEFEMMVAETHVPTSNTSVLGMKIPSLPFVPLSEWMAQNLTAENTVTLTAPSQNPQFGTELPLTVSKIRAAKAELENFLHRLETRESPADELIYNSFLQVPHVLELVLEAMIQEFAYSESMRFSAPGSDPAIAATARTLDATAEVIRAVLENLRNAETSLSSLT